MSVSSNDDGERGTDGSRARSVALTLMRMALALLDEAGEGVAAARLHGAIDALEPVATTVHAFDDGHNPI